MRPQEIIRYYDLCDASQLRSWVRQYRNYGTCIDERGKTTKAENPRKGRPKKTSGRSLEDYSKNELIVRCKMLEDIKTFAYLENLKLKKNIKS